MLERDGLAGLDAARGGARGRRVACRADPSFRRSHRACQRTRGDRLPAVQRRDGCGLCAGYASSMARAMARAKAYVAYAQAHPGMYGLMFRTERLDYARPSLHEAAEASFAGLAGAIGASRQEQIPKAR